MKRLILLIILICLSIFGNSQLYDGSYSPNFSGVDLNGDSHNLYSYLDSGYTVVLWFEATWDPNGWNYFSSSAFQDLWSNHGPSGNPGVSATTTDDVVVIYIEADNSTTLADLQGTGGNTQGDWVTGTNYPIIDNASFNQTFEISYYPTIYTIYPDRYLEESGLLSATDHYNNISSKILNHSISTGKDVCVFDVFYRNKCISSLEEIKLILQNKGDQIIYPGEVQINLLSNGVIINSLQSNDTLFTLDSTLIDFSGTTINGFSDTTFIIELDYIGDINFSNNFDTLNAGKLITTGTTSDLNLSIKFDNYPNETSWQWKDSSDILLNSYSNYNSSANSLQTVNETLTNNGPGCYKLEFFDSFGDGLGAAQWGGTDGYFSVIDGNTDTLLQVFGDFGVNFFSSISVIDCNNYATIDTIIDSISDCNLPYILNNVAYSSSGNFTQTFTNFYGCDSIIVLDLTVLSEIEPSICLVSVDSTSSKNLIVWEKPIVNYIDSFFVYRDIVGTYTKVGAVPYDSLSQFVDTTNGVNPNTTSYRYKLSVLDSCGNESVLSDFHETIHLTVSSAGGNDKNLIWDNYEGFSFVYYRIWRDDIGNGNWNVLDSVTSSNTTYTDITSPSPNSNYFIEVIPPSTCTSTKAIDHNSSRSNRQSGVVSNGGAPSSNFSTSITQITTGTSIDFLDQSINNPTTWSWDFYGANPSTSNSQNPTNITYNNIGLYDVRLIVSNANGIDTLVKTNYIEVISSGGVAPTSGFIASDTQIQEGNSIDFLDQSQNNPTSWTWLFDGGSPSFSTNQSPTGVLYNTSGSYDVTLITSNSFGADTLLKSAYINVSSSTSINENGESKLTVHPNPTQDQITIDIKGYNGPVNVEVFDLQGRLLETTRTTTVSLRKYERGIYIFKVSYGEITEEVRVVKE